MTTPMWAGAVLAAAAAILAAPSTSPRQRWRRLARGRAPGPAHAARPFGSGGSLEALRRRRAGATRSGREPSVPWPAVVGLAVVVPAAIMLGPAGGVALAAYAAAGVGVGRRRTRERAAGRARSAAVDAVASLATELRAGVAVGPALAGVAADLSYSDGAGESGGAKAAGSAAAIGRRVAAAVELAEVSGAPLAEVLDRLDADLRAADRVRASALAQVAGARVSALLLAAMPLAGIGLGYAVGTDPLRILLHTPLGGACLLLAVALQVTGLAWADRLARVEVAQ